LESDGQDLLELGWVFHRFLKHHDHSRGVIAVDTNAKEERDVPQIEDFNITMGTLVNGARRVGNNDNQAKEDENVAET